MSKHILLVGHCGVDGPRLKSEISRFMPDVEISRINSTADLRRACDEGADLLLINREPLGFEPKLGQDLVRELHAKYRDCRLILVSDIAEAQEEATQAGALPGFGKSDIGTTKFEDTLREALRN